MATPPPDGRRRRPPRLMPDVLRREPQFRLLFASQVLSVLGDRVTQTAMPFAVLITGGGVAEVAVVSAAQFLPFIALALPAGVWADRLDRKRFLLASDTVRMVTQAVAAVLLLTGRATVPELAVLAAVFGAADAFFQPAFSGLWPATLVDQANLQPANALRGLTFSTANVVGPVVAGVVIAAAGGPGTALALDAGTFAVSLALLLPLRRVPGSSSAIEVEAGAHAPQPPADRAESFLDSLHGGWREVTGRGWLLGFLGGLGAYHLLVLPAVFVVGPVLMADDYDGARSMAVVSALFGAGNILGDLLLLRWRPRRALRVASLMLVGASAQAAVFGSGLPVVGIGLLELLAGVCVTGTFTLWETSLAEHIPPTALSRVSSYDYLTSVGVLPLGNLLLGVTAASLGLHPTLWLMSVLGIGTALFVAALPSVRRLPRGVVVQGVA